MGSSCASIRRVTHRAVKIIENPLNETSVRLVFRGDASDGAVVADAGENRSAAERNQQRHHDRVTSNCSHRPLLLSTRRMTHRAVKTIENPLNEASVRLVFRGDASNSP